MLQPVFIILVQAADDELSTFSILNALSGGSESLLRADDFPLHRPAHNELSCSEYIDSFYIHYLYLKRTLSKPVKQMTTSELTELHCSSKPRLLEIQEKDSQLSGYLLQGIN